MAQVASRAGRSQPIAGSPQHAELDVDWGLNAAVLFGRQKAAVDYQLTGQYRSANRYAFRQVTFAPTPVNKARSHSVTVPNVGGFAGLTYRMDNFKMSAGYKADFFFGAMDGGIDSRKSKDIGFFGPFATVSIGLGG